MTKHSTPASILVLALLLAVWVLASATLMGAGSKNKAQPSRRQQPKGSSQQVQEVKGREIRRIDFGSFTYITSLCDREYGLTKVIRTHKGEFKSGSGSEEVYFGIVDNKIVYGDLTGDGREEAIVQTACGLTMGNAGTEEIFVYALRSGHAEVLGAVNDDDMTRDYQSHYPEGILWRICNDGVKIKVDELIVERFADGSHAGPKYIVTMEYRWNGHALVLNGIPRKKEFTG